MRQFMKIIESITIGPQSDADLIDIFHYIDEWESEFSADYADDGEPNLDKLRQSADEAVVRLTPHVHQPMAIWREEIRHDRNFETVGAFWTWDENYARSYEGNHIQGSRVVFAGSVRPSDVNWTATVAKNMIFPSEREIFVNTGTTIRIVGITIDGERHDVAFDARVDVYYGEDE